jgi:1,4-dihydroxy-6-naphthoate synthase
MFTVMLNLTIGFSPCPNDTFIFDAMIHQKIDTEGLTFEPIMEDVEALNQKAFRGELDITKLSYHAYAHLVHHYVLLNSGSALGNNCGPLLISKKTPNNWKSNIYEKKIAIPGKYTTANFLLNFAFPNIKNKEEIVFHDIENAVLEQRVDAGVIIHENRFTYQKRGLEKWLDLGEHWEQTTGFPIPLGGIVMNRNFDKPLIEKVNRVLRKSVEYAFANPENVMPFVRTHAQEMSDDVMKQHIALYVNDYTIDLGEKGKAAVQYLFDYAIEKGFIEKPGQTIFI